MDAERIAETRRLKRRLILWRLLAAALGVATVVAVIGRFGYLPGGSYVARLAVEGIIVDDPLRDAALADLAKDENAKALIVRIDSPGGTVVGGESLFLGLKALAERKPVIAVIGELGTSAAYMTALGADRIIARSGSVTGSIGVILQSADITGLLEKLGIKPEAIKSSPLKAQPNPFEPLSEEARLAAAAVVGDMYDLFVDIVENRRQMPRDKVLLLADGRIFTGRQALEQGLIDGLGGETDARDWLSETHGILRKLPVREVEIGDDEGMLPGFLGEIAGKMLFSERLRLDGLVSVWHPVFR